jgi:hypothetical protein
MYPSVGAAVWAMVRWRERCRAAKAAPFPDHVPKGASTYDRWRYIYVSPTRCFAHPEPDDDRDPETVHVLFARYDRRQALTRLLIKGQSLDDFGGSERRRARKARNHFIRELCHRGLLLHPRKGCFQNANNQCPRFPRQDWTGG